MKRILISSSVLVSSIILSLAFYFVTENITTITEIHKTMDIIDGEQSYVGVKEDINYKGYDYYGFVKDEFTSLNTSYQVDEKFGLQQYSVNGLTFNFDTSLTNLIEDDIYLNGKNIYKEVYYSDDMLLDTIFCGESYIEYSYNNDNTIDCIAINDGLLSTKYDGNNNIISTSLNENIDKQFEYFADELMLEISSNKSINYSYDYNGKLQADLNDEYLIDYSFRKVELSLNGIKTKYHFDYKYNNSYYVSQIDYDNNESIYLSYLREDLIEATHSLTFAISSGVTFLANLKGRPPAM